MTVLSTGTAAPGAITLKNVENLSINTTGNGYTLNSTGYTDLTSLVIVGAGTSGDAIVTAATTTTVSVTASAYDGDFTITGGKNVTVSGTAADDMLIDGAVGTATVTGGAQGADRLSIDAQGLTSVTVLDGGIVAIGDGLDAMADVTFNDDATTDTLTTVSITGAAGAMTVNSDVLTSLTVADSAQNATVTAAAATRALALTVNKLTGGTIADAEATTLNLSTTGTASTGVTINAAKATAATIAADVALTATLGLDVATSLAVSGDSLVTPTLTDTDSLASVTVSGSAGLSADLSAQTALTAITATDTSGANTVTVDATKATYAGGSGVDSVTVLATVTKAINGGAGSDDVFTWSVDGSYTTDADVTGFEIIAAGALVDADTISATGYTRLQQGVTTGDVTWSNVAANSKLTITEDTGGNTAVNLASTAGTSDQFNLVLTKSGAAGVLAAGQVTVAGVETIAITSDDSDTTLVSPTNTLTLVAGSVTSLTVAGDAGLNLTYTGTTATTIDASSITAGAFTYDSGALAAAATATIKGSAAGTNTIDFSEALGIVTYTGGTGNDTINFANANALANVVTLGNGTNGFNGGTNANGADQITGGTGADKITISGNTADLFYAAAGGDTGTNTSTTIQTAQLTSTFDVVYGATTGITISLGVTSGANAAGYGGAGGATDDITEAHTNLAGVADEIVFARGGYNADAGTFTYAANGSDSVMTYDASGAGSAFNSIVLVGFVATANTDVIAGVVTL